MYSARQFARSAAGYLYWHYLHGGGADINRSCWKIPCINSKHIHHRDDGAYSKTRCNYQHFPCSWTYSFSYRFFGLKVVTVHSTSFRLSASMMI
ncbi:hypothetical protein CHUAL_001675 [Chamberlinius hualienensis]